MSMEDEVKPPIWARPEPRSRGLSRTQIVQTALRIADEEGLDEVTMRRVAREVRSGAMSLYHYFESRDELLELMAETVGAEMLVPELPGDWREALTAIAQHSRAAFLKHPWLLTTLSDRPRVTPNLLRHIEQSAQSVAALEGVERERLSGIVTAVDDYTIGFTLREVMGGSTDRGRKLAARFAEAFDEPYIRYLLESGEFPMLSAFAAAGGGPAEPTFEQGLGWLLDGFEATLRR